jgi:hypothetical protein
MEDDFKYFWKWNTTQNKFVNGRRPKIFLQMEDNLKYLCKSKTTSNILTWKAASNIFVNGRGTQVTQFKNGRCSLMAGRITVWVKSQLS